MAAYVLLDIEVRDPVGYEEYRLAASRSLENYGGRYIVRGGDVRVLEGSATPHRLVIVEFPSLEMATRWYTSEEYRACAPIRQRTAETTVLLVEGI